MADVLELLDKLNRKERYAVVCQALGVEQFTPSWPFLSELLAASGTTVDHPAAAVCWMDYHLDWLYAALELAKNGLADGPFPSPGFPGAQGATLNVNVNQEDVDLLVAVSSQAGVHLFLVEAKWGSSWSTSQFASKLRRIKHIFGQDGGRYSGVFPRVVLASTATPTHLLSKVQAITGGELPAPWMLNASGDALAHMRLKAPGNRITLFRANDQGEKVLGDHWSWKSEPPV